MYSNARIVNNLAKLCRQYTDDLAQPFHENCMENAEAETPIPATPPVIPPVKK